MKWFPSANVSPTSATPMFPKNCCQDCGQPVKPRQFHDYVSCILWRTKNVGYRSDPFARDLSVLRDHIFKLEPKRRVT